MNPKIPSLIGALSLALAGCATGPADAPFDRKVAGEKLSTAQRLALATGVNDEVGDPISDIPRSEIEQAQDLPESERVSNLEGAAGWTAAELGVEGLTGASLTPLPALITLFEPPEAPERYEKGAIFVWAQSPVDYEGLAREIREAFVTTIERRGKELERGEAVLEQDYTLMFRARQAGRDLKLALNFPKDGHAKAWFLDNRYRTAEQEEVAPERVPHWLPNDNNVLIREVFTRFGQYDVEEERWITGTKEQLPDSFPGVDDLAFMKEFSEALPENMAVYHRHTEGIEGMVPMFLHDGKVYPFVEPPKDSVEVSQTAAAR